jgi:CDP-diacylglycerol--glycerol-3-phosphate 3-phosphatidyltransferase
MTTANKITIFRILLIPFFVVEVLNYMKTGNEIHRLFAIIPFGVATVCDGVDGFIARRFNQRSELGAILDPLGDKLLLVSGVLLFSVDNPHFGSLPFWLSCTIIGRDVLLLIGLVVVQMIVGKVKVRPRIPGKIATVLQMLCIIWILLKWNSRFEVPWFKIWTIGAAVFTGVSGLFYVFDGVKQLSSHPASSATARQEPE